MAVNANELATINTQNQYMGLIQTAVEKGSDINQLEKLMDLQERYEANQAKKAFNAAMSKFQSMLPVIEKLGIVDYTTGKGRTYYRYAKLEDIAQAIKPALKETGLSYRFTQTQDRGVITVTCIVTHELGHSEFSSLESSPDLSGGKDQLKGIASAVAYLRRYTLTGILGIVVGGEDDGEEQQITFEGEQIDPNANKAPECYPNDEFKKNFPAWKKQIEGGKKTVDQMHAFLTARKIILSQEQYDKLSEIGATNEN